LSAPGDAGLDVRVVEGRGVEADDWVALAGQARETPPQLLPGWQEAWWRHRGGGSRRVTITVRRAGLLVAIVPLSVRTCGVGVIAAMDWGVSDGIVALPDDVEAARAGLAALSRAGVRVMVWGGLRPDALILRAAAAPVHLVERAAAPVLDLDTEWETTFARIMGKRTRQKLVTKWRGLDRLGAVDVTVLSSRKEILASLDPVRAIHRARWEPLIAERGLRDRSAFASEDGMRFLRDALGGLADDGAARMLILAIDGRPVAFRQYAIVGGVLHGERSGFVPDIAHQSPGLLVIVRSFEAAVAEGASLANLGHGTDDYKRQLTDREIGVARGVMAVGTVGGRLLAAGLVATFRARRIVRESSLPANVRSLRRRIGDARRRSP
jgi:CelD/BcsL family acetyltransferase involved in cellulose biosynthesis